MADPVTPNYIPTVGRLTVDRFDFQKHVNGQSFKHQAAGIEINPLINIDGYDYADLQSALEELATLANSPLVIPAATTGSQGIVRLAGDIAGTANSVTVTRIQNRPVSSLAPSSGNLLTWNGSSWAPAAPTLGFTAGGDLSGNATSQQVIGLTGASGSVNIFANTLSYVSGVTATLTQATSSAIDGYNLTFRAQSTTAATRNGGNLVVSGGTPGSGGLKGGVKLQLDSDNMVQVCEVAASRRVLSLCKPSDLTTTDMPDSTGSGVIYIYDAGTIPTVGNPANGAILYSLNGALRTKNSDGADFAIGDVRKRTVYINKSTQNIAVTTANNFITNTSNGSNVTITLATSGAVNGDWIEVIHPLSAYAGAGLIVFAGLTTSVINGTTVSVNPGTVTTFFYNGGWKLEKVLTHSTYIT